jgi:hypothetical protein
VPASAPAPRPSTNVIKDGLSVTVTLPKTTFAVNEPIRFTVQFKNISDKGFVLYDPSHFWNWRITFEDQRKIGPWRVSKLFDELLALAPRTLKPGDSADVPVSLEQGKTRPFEFVWEGLQRKIVEPVKSLPIGRYQLVIEMDLKGGPPKQDWAFPFWTGQIKTEPVEFEITDKAAASPPSLQSPRTGPRPSTCGCG